ncbi:MAG: response regulator [Candidatus Zixiibacteriota bacterium]
MENNKRQTLLLVDDEKHILTAMRRLFSELDAEIFTASNGEEALAILAKQNVSVIISDQRMPQMTGVEMFKHAKRISPESVRILLTGYADIDVTVDAINSGEVKYYLNKPWDDQQLLSQVKESLENQKIKAENRRLAASLATKNRQLNALNELLEQKVLEQTEVIRKQHEDLQKSFMETIRAFSTVMEMRYKEVGLHTHRVATLAKELVRHLSLSEKEQRDIVVAAFLHDIGKIALPEELLRKDYKLCTPSEKAHIQKHTIIGQSCVCAIGGFEDIALVIRHHHEEYDGSGYPDRLKGEAVPLGARIIHVLNVYDREAYKYGDPDRKSLNDASAYLVKNSGARFDPEIVKKIIEHDIGHEFFLQEASQTVLLQPKELQPGMVISEDIYTENGMFILPKGAQLSIGMIKRINKINAADRIDKGIHVVKDMNQQGDLNAKVSRVIGRRFGSDAERIDASV